MRWQPALNGERLSNPAELDDSGSRSVALQLDYRKGKGEFVDVKNTTVGSSGCTPGDCDHRAHRAGLGAPIPTRRRRTGAPRRPPDGPGGFGVLHFGPLVEQLIFPCRNDCVQAEHSCRDAAESAALTCATQTCAATITNAQTDCAADRSSQACLTDVSALITCVQPCIVTESTALPACAATVQGV